MDSRFVICSALLLLLLWLGPYLPVIFAMGDSRRSADPDAPKRDRRLFKVCAYGALAVGMAALLSWWTRR